MLYICSVASMNSTVDDCCSLFIMRCSHSFGSDGCFAVGPLLNRVALSFRRLWRASYQSGAVAVRRSIETKPVYCTCLEALHVARVTRGSAGASVQSASDGSVSAESLPRSLSLCSSSQ